MPSSGRTKEFILITLDEHSSLVAGKISNDNHTFVNPNDTRSRSPEICVNCNLENSINTPREFTRALEFAQMNLKTRFGKATTSTLSDAKRTEDEAAAMKSENVILDLLSCRLSGGKVETAQQILGKISNSEHVSINSISERICLHDTDTGLAVLEFLSSIQIPTRKIDDLSLYLVRRLVCVYQKIFLRTLLLKEWHQKWKEARTKTVKTHSHHFLDPIMNTPKGCVYTEVNHNNCQNHPKKREVVLVYHG